MKNIGILAIASLVALVLGVSSFASTPTAHADVDGSVAIGCEFLAAAIDGDISDTDVTAPADFGAACTGGISSTGDNPQTVVLETKGEAQTLAATLGDADGVLEVADFDDVDLDANQIQAFPVTGIVNSLYIFAFVDDAQPVTFDADAGLTVSFPGETCTTEDADCDPASVAAVRDGVVVATVTAATGADSGDEIDVTIIQEGDDATSEKITVTGTPNEVTLTLVKTTVQESGGASALADCKLLKVTDGDALSNPDSTIAIAVVVDNRDVKLTRVPVTLAIDDADVAAVGKNTGVSVDGGTSGIAYFAVLCGDDIGETDVTATIGTGPSADTDTELFTVVGEPSSVALTASPAIIACDGTQTSTVTATVTDSAGDNVANGTRVNFSVVALGTANPINTTTTDGKASSTITPLSGATAGVTVLVTAGDAQASIRVDCALPIAPTATGGSPVATPTRVGIRVSDTGNGGYIGQDSSAGFPAWTLVALALGSFALVAGGMVTRRVSK